MNVHVQPYFMAGMPLEPKRSRKFVRKFAFSPREAWVADPKPTFTQPAAFQGPIAPHKPYEYGHDPLPVTSDERSWLNYRPVFTKDVPEHTKPPIGTVPPLEGLGSFINRVDEINAIAKTQMLDLATVGQELAATGVASFSMSSSSDDDDLNYEVSDEDIERNATRYGTAYTTQDLAPVLDTIEWEKQIAFSGQPQRVWLDTTDGKVQPVSPSKTLTTEQITSLGRKLYRAMGKPTAQDIEDSRAKAEYYGWKTGSIIYGVTKGEHTPEQSMDILGQEDLEEVTTNGGPQELGLHNVENGVVAYEPSEREFWPEEFVLADEFAA